MNYVRYACVRCHRWAGELAMRAARNLAYPALVCEACKRGHARTGIKRGKPAEIIRLFPERE